MTEQLPYTHPTIRTQTHDQLLFRLDAIRNRRLVAAIEYRQASQARQERDAGKASDKWLKQSELISRKLSKMEDDIRSIDKAIANLIETSHKFSLLSNE